MNKIEMATLFIEFRVFSNTRSPDPFKGYEINVIKCA